MPFSPATSSVALGSTTASATTTIVLVEADAAHAGGGTAHGAHVRFLEADAHAFAGDEHRLARCRWSACASMRLSFCSMPMAMMPPLRQLAKSSSEVFFTVPCCVAKRTIAARFPGDVVALRVLLRFDADERGDFFARPHLEQVGDGAALGGAAHVGNLVHALDVNAAACS